MKSVALPAAILIALIVAGLTWTLWPGGLERGLAARSQGDYAAALRHLRPLAEQGDRSAEFALGEMIAAGQGAEQNTAAGVEWILKAATHQHPGAAVALGDRFARGDGVPASPDTALNWYARAAAAGDASGLQRMTALAEQDSAQARYALGRLYARGEGVPQARHEAARLFRQAAARGIPEAGAALLALDNENVAEAAFQLAQMHAQGEAMPRDLAKAAALYARAGDQAHALAQVRLAEMYDRGEGVARDAAKAAEWYAKAARQSHTQAQYRLGQMLMRGHGVEKNPAEAVRWMRAAVDGGVAEAVPALQAFAAAGNAQAQYALGSLHAQGKLMAQDSTLALEWMRKAAVQGLALAQFDLAYAYEEGVGAPVERAAAAHWYGEATAQGFVTAIPKLAHLAANGEPVAQYYYGRYLLENGAAQPRRADQPDDLINAALRWYRALRSDPQAEGVALLRKAAANGHAAARELLLQSRPP